MALKIVKHLNYIGYNPMFPQDATLGDLEVFCKKYHDIRAPLMENCGNCPYFSGVMQGYGHECTWEDVVPADVDEIVVDHNDRQKELMRVSKLIDQGYLQKG